MNITPQTTVKEILAARPDALQVFEQHGVDVSLECDESTQECELELCDSMCHIDGLIADLQKLFGTAQQADS